MYKLFVDVGNTPMWALFSTAELAAAEGSAGGAVEDDDDDDVDAEPW
jgi:hypothetical protein